MQSPLLGARPIDSITVTLEGRPIKVVKRFAWMLKTLIERGERGVTTIEVPGVRMSHYVMMLRRQGFVIETADEKHGGAFPGRHGRYILRSPVKVVEVIYGGGKRDAA